MESPNLRTLVASTLKSIPGSLFLFADAAPLGREAITGAGEGLDLAAGERILAAALYRDTPKRGIEHRCALAITDRRSTISGWASVKMSPMLKLRTSLLHRDLVAAPYKSSMLSKSLELKTASASLSLPFEGHILEPLAGFYAAMGQSLPPDQRCEPPSQFVEPSEDDPTGARAASEALWNDDVQARAMLSTIENQYQGGVMTSELARDFVGRVVLAHRTVAGAPGMIGGRWISSLSANDLGHFLVSCFGQPRAYATPEPGVQQLDFALDPRGNALSQCLARMKVSSFSGFITLSPGKAIAGAMLKKQPVTHLRVMFTDSTGCSLYRPFTGNTPLEGRDSLLALAAHILVQKGTYPVLERRIALGWNPDYQALFA